MRRIALMFPLALLAGCPENPDGRDDTGGPTDTGPTTEFEPGCITVAGGGGYAHVQDAITMAADGDEIVLCDGVYDESILVDKAVVITGQSATGVVVNGQGTDPAFRITAAATLTNLSLSSTYTGVIVDGAVGATLDGLSISAAYWGVQLDGAQASVVTSTTIDQPGGGGLQVSGGTATLTGLQITSPSGFGVQALNGADVTLEGSTIDGVIMTSDDVTDGYGLNVMDAALTTSGNTITNAQGVGIWSEGSDLDMTGDVFDGNAFLGMYAVDGAIDLDGLTLSNSALAGGYVIAPAINVSNVTSDADPKTSCSYDYADWGGEQLGPWCGGLLLGGDVVTLTGASVSGWNNYGVYIGGYTSDGMPATVSDLTITNTGRWGLYLYGMESTVSGLNVTGLREPEMPSPCADTKYIYLDRSVALLQVEGSLTLTESSFAENQSWGISVVQGQSDINSTTFTNHACSGILNYVGAVAVRTSTFSGAWSNGNIWNYQGSSIIEGNHFVDNHQTYRGSYEYDGHLYEYTYTGYGLDIYSYDASSVEITGNVFERGDQGISLYTSGAWIHDNTWTGYDGEILYTYQSADTIEFEDNTVEDFGSYVVLNYYGDVALSDTTLGTQRAATIYYENYTDGVLTSSGSYPSASSAVYSYGSSSYPTSVTIDGLTATDLPYGLVSVNDIALEMYDVSVESVGSAGSTFVYAAWSGTNPVATLSDVRASTVGGSGLYLYSSNTSDSYVEVSGLDFDTVTGAYAVFQSGLGAWTLSDSDLGTVSAYGLYSDADASTDQTTVDGLMVDAASSYGIYVSEGVLDLRNSSGTNGGNTGLTVYGATASIVGNTFTGNGTYGMSCSSTTLVECSDNVLTGNGMGTHSGCDDACVAVEDDDGGGGSDTGL